MKLSETEKTEKNRKSSEKYPLNFFSSVGFALFAGWVNLRMHL